jgi:hypothetical protein
MGRLIGERMKGSLGQPIIIEKTSLARTAASVLAEWLVPSPMVIE